MAIERSERIRQDLERVVGDETATFLMDRPPGGWSELVTRDVLDDKIDALRQEMRAMHFELVSKMAELSASVDRRIAEQSASVDRRLRAQTWATTSALVAMAGAIVASAAL